MDTASDDIARLELILRELREAVVACDGEGRIILFNPAVKKLFSDSEGLFLGQSLYKICGKAPFEYAFRLLLQGRTQGKPSTETRQSSFVCSTLRDNHYLLCNMNLIATPKNKPFFFILTFEDATRKITDANQEDRLLKRIIRGLRGPLTNLNAAADNLRNHPEMDEEMHHAFEEVIFRESDAVVSHFAEFVKEADSLSAAPWPLNDVHSADFLQCVIRLLPSDSPLRATMTGVPLWLQADTYLLTLTLIHLLHKLEATQNVVEVDLETLLGDRHVYIDIVWKGEPLGLATIAPWLREPLSDPMFDMTIEEVLERHDSEIWSQRHRRSGYSVLRIPVPISPKLWEESRGREREQPVFYDFALLERKFGLNDMGKSPLSALDYVVFDTETTGLSPESGDEIFSISAVRIQDQRILIGENFSCLVRPRRPLSQDLLTNQGLNEDSLQDKPSIKIALAKFRAFIGDAVLVTHNAAFEMKFIRHEEDLAGVKFDNPLLDTLLLSSVVDPKGTDLTLAGIAKKLGIETAGQFMALGDTFATAQVFLKLLDLLLEKGITTLDEAVAASERVLMMGDKGLGE